MSGRACTFWIRWYLICWKLLTVPSDDESRVLFRSRHHSYNWCTPRFSGHARTNPGAYLPPTHNWLCRIWRGAVISPRQIIITCAQQVNTIKDVGQKRMFYYYYVDNAKRVGHFNSLENHNQFICLMLQWDTTKRCPEKLDQRSWKPSFFIYESLLLASHVPLPKLRRASAAPVLSMYII